mmetsp:Transcript_26622/g.37499  ORF Transcript_26622/g.37499 Transcript_26622/m.37499 type:complete len:370 (-) Transcript_26622:1394-2503(-)
MIPNTITVFSSIPNVAKSLKAAVSLTSIRSPPHIHEIIDQDALGGYGGTIEFDVTKLADETRIQLQKAEILVTEPAVLASIILHDKRKPIGDIFPNLKWCQSTYAGVDPLFNNPDMLQCMPLPFTLTRFAGKFGPPIAEWCIGRIVSHERQFQTSHNDQQHKRWVGTPTLTQYRYMSDLTMVILGCGDIGRCIAQTGKALGMKTIGYVQTPRNDVPGFDQCTTNLSQALSQADYIVSVLPSTKSTQGFLNDGVLKECIKSNIGHDTATNNGDQHQPPVFINVGRGDVIDEVHLLQALDEGYLSAAILDVFPTEPLPPTSKLWDHPKVTVSPHISGLTRAADVPDLVLDNYDRYVKGEPLRYVVDYYKTY